MNQKYSWIITPVIFVFIALIFHLSSPNFADLDSFYYFGQATALRERGIFNTEFPWLPYSKIGELSSSLWYGFSLLIIPFSYFGVIGIKIAGVLLTASASMTIWLVLKKTGVKTPIAWSLFLFFTAPNVLTQFLMVRPQTVSLIAVPALFYFLINDWILGILIASFIIAWTHLNFLWVPILMFIAIAAIKFWTERKMPWRETAAVFGGVLAGWLFRPEAINAIKLFYIQVIQQILEKQSGLPLLFGKENFPLAISILFKNFLPFLILWLAALYFLFQYHSQIKNLSNNTAVIVYSSGILSLIFFLFSVLVARRAYNLWAEFGIIFIAAIFTHFIYKSSGQDSAKFMIIAALIFSVFYSGIKGINALQKNGYPQNHLKEAGLWLKANSNPGDIVFNLHWPDFSPLFFWNQTNYYIGGLDPIFQYSYNPSLYWKFHYLSADQVTSKTCGYDACTTAMLEDTYEVLRRDFNAKYVLLNKRRNPGVNLFLEKDSRFEKKLDTEKETIYAIK